jgi:hypothetical protein
MSRVYTAASAAHIPTVNGASSYCQRWTERQHSWRHVSEGGFDSRRFEVADLDEPTARAFVERHHYSGNYPGDLQRYGLYSLERLVGVAVLGNAGFKPVLTSAFPDLEPYSESSELARLVLLDEVPANAESWFLAEVFRSAAAQGMRGVVSFSDPLPRIDRAGRVVMPGHVGTIYQASNATYTGHATPRTVWFHDGELFNEQALGKIRLQKQGHEYAEAQLCSWGARPRRSGEDPKAWLHTALREAGCTSSRHPGNHRYLFALGDRRARRAVSFGFSGQAYPKKEARA